MSSYIFELIRTYSGKEKESPTSSPQEQEKAKQRNKALKTTATPDGKGRTKAINKWTLKTVI